jgi:Ca2+-binding EF-hand superfamily protein
VDPRFRGYAESLLRQYDKNKNGQLERDEWSELRGGLRDSDRNGDGIVTLDELTAKLAEFSQRRGDGGFSGHPPSSGPGGPPSSGSSSLGSTSGQPKSYRFKSATERLPPGLPEWFARKDTNEDGQISMAEFASRWTERDAREFIALDANNDGIITPEECLKASRR